MKVHHLIQKRFSDDRRDELRERKVVDLFLSDNVVFFALCRSFQKETDRSGDVTAVYIKARTRLGLFFVSVDSNLFPVQHFPDYHRYEFLGMLTLAEYIHRVRDEYRQIVRIRVCEAKFLAARFRRGVRVARIVAVPFFVSDSFGCRTKDLIGREVQYLLHRIRPRIIEQICRRDDVVHDKFHRVIDGAVDVGGCRQVQNNVDMPELLGDELVYRSLEVMPCKKYAVLLLFPNFDVGQAMECSG